MFGAVIASAAVLYVVAGRRYWFRTDEWNYLIGRNRGDVEGLLRAYNQHWSTIPILIYRLLWQTVGLNTYRPYQVLVIALHLTAAILLRIVMRRAGVGPWIATAVASMFVLLAGAGWQDIVWGLQIGFVGSLVCGLAQLLLADHDGPLDRRDAAGLAFGVVGLMCSAVALTMVVVVGLAMALRRRWSAGVLHTVPLALLFMSWRLTVGRSDEGTYGGGRPSTASSIAFVRHGAAHALRSVGGPPGFGEALAVVLVVGLVLAWAPLSFDEVAQRAALPLSMLTGALLFLVITALGRAEVGSWNAGHSRYLHIVIALIAPALAVAADAIARRWRLALPLLLVLVLAGVPRNLAQLWPDADPADAIPMQGSDGMRDRALFLAVAHSPLLGSVPPDFHPFHGSGSASVTAGWLRDAVAHGRIPDFEPSPRVAAEADVVLMLRQTPAPTTTARCHPLRAHVEVVQPGWTKNFQGTMLVSLVSTTGDAAGPVAYESRHGSQLTAQGGPTALRLAPSPGKRAAECA